MKKKETLPEEPTVGSSAWKFFLAAILLLIILIGVVGVSRSYQKQKIDDNRYNGFDFAQSAEGLWVTQLQVGTTVYDIPFYYHPKDVEYIPAEHNAVVPVQGGIKQVTISVDPDAKAQVVIAAVEISRILGQRYRLYNHYVSSALSRPSRINESLAVVTCNDATPTNIVIQLIPGSSDAVVRSKNPSCVILQYIDDNSSIMVADRYAYMLVGIMK